MTTQQSLKEVFDKVLGTDITSEDLTQEVMSVFMRTLDKSFNFKSELQRSDVFVKMFTDDIEAPIFEDVSSDNGGSFQYDVSTLIKYILDNYKPVNLDDNWVYGKKIGIKSKLYTLAFIVDEFEKYLRNGKVKTN